MFHLQDVKDSCMCVAVETSARIVQQSFTEDNDPEYVMYVANDITRTVIH